MATIKSFSDLPQSKKLAEILPLESADNHYWRNAYNNYICGLGNSVELKEKFEEKGLKYLPCWSLAALIEVLPSIEGFKHVIDLDINQIRYEGKYRDELTVDDVNLIDACYGLIIKLKENNLI